MSHLNTKIDDKENKKKKKEIQEICIQLLLMDFVTFRWFNWQKNW